MCGKASLVKLLLLAMATAWGTCPPAVRHAHEGGGDASHRHSRIQHDEHGHSHDTRTDNRVELSNTRSAVGDCGDHLHWVLLGFGLTLPATPNSQVPQEPFAFEPVLVRLVEDLASPAAGQTHDWAADLANTSASLPGLVCVVSAPLRWVSPFAALPLCDSARFERSGVLQA